MVIDLRKDFALKHLVNMSQRLIKEQGVEGRVWVTIEADAESDIGFSVVLVDAGTHEKLKVKPERLYAHYHSITLDQYLSDLPQA